MSNDVKDFAAFAALTLTNVESLYELFSAKNVSNGYVHPLSRPGLVISVDGNHEKFISVNLILEGGLLVSIKEVGRGNYQFLAHVSVNKKVEIIEFNLKDPLYDQVDTARRYWRSCSTDVQTLLNTAIECIQSNTPMQLQKTTWPIALCNALKVQPGYSYYADEWQAWLSTWGTTTMQTSFQIAQSIFDEENDFFAFKSQVIESWIFPHSTASHGIDPVVFESDSLY